MADDIVRLGLAIDSRPLADATRALDGFARAAGPAAAGAKNVENNALGAGRATETFRLGAQKAQAEVTALGKGATDASINLNRVGEASATGGAKAATGVGLARHEMVNLGRQVQDVGTMLALGSSPFQVLASQGAQVADIFMSTQGSFRGFLGQLASAITPIRLLGAGLAVGSVAAIALGASWKHSALALDETSKAADVAIGKLRALEAAATGKGIDFENFNKSAQRFNAAIYDARNSTGGLFEVLRANNLEVGTFEETWQRASDLIRNAASHQQALQLLQQMGLPATAEWVRLLSQGGEHFKILIAGASSFDEAAEQSLVAKARKFDEAWASTWKSFSDNAKAAIVSLDPWFDRLVMRGREFALNDVGQRNVGQRLLSRGEGTPLQQNFDNFYTGVSSKFGSTPLMPAGASVDPEILKRQLALEQQRIGALGQLASITEQVRAKELELQLARLNGSNITDTDTKRILAFTEVQALGLLTLRQQTDAQKIEAQALQMGIGPAAGYRAEQEKLTEFRRLGIDLTRQQTAAIRLEAGALGEATQAAALRRAQGDVGFQSSQIWRSDTEQQVATQMRSLYGEEYRSHMNDALANQIRFNSAMSETKTLATSVGSELLKGALQGKSGTELLSNAVSTLGNRLIEIASNQIIYGFFNMLAMPFGGGLSGGGLGGGLFGSLFAEGGYTGPGGKYQPAGIVHAGEYVFNQAAVNRIGVSNLDRLHRGYSEGGFVERVPRIARGYVDGGFVDRVPSLPAVPSGVAAGGPASGAAQAGAASESVSVSVPIHIDARGAEKGSGEEIGAMMQALVESRAFKATIVRAIQDARSRKVL